MNSFHRLFLKFRHFPFWAQAVVTFSCAAVLVVLWSACGLPPPRPRPAPPPLSSPHIELHSHFGPVFGLAFSPDGQWLASLTADNQVRLWDISKGVVLRTMGGPKTFAPSLALSPDGKVLATGSYDKTATLWDVATGDKIRTLSGHQAAISCVMFSPDSHTLASASRDGSVVLWDASSGEQLRTFTGHTGMVNAVAFSPDGRLLASASNDRSVRLWDPQTGTLTRSLPHESRVVSLAFSPDGKLLASGTALLHGLRNAPRAEIRLWDVNTGTEQAAFGKISGEIRALAFSPDSSLLASGEDFGDPTLNSTLTLWDVKKQFVVSHFEVERPYQLHTIAYSPDGRWLATGGYSGRIRLWQ